MFKITIEELVTTQVNGLPSVESGDVIVKRYEQTVDAIDLRAVMAAVNRKPRNSRAKRKAMS